MTTLSTRVRAMLCAVFLLFCLGLYAQDDSYTYTIYYHTNSAEYKEDENGNWVSNNCWGESGDNFVLYIQVYSGSDGNYTYYTSGTWVNDSNNWATCTWTGISYIFSWTYTSETPLPDETMMKFTSSWSNGAEYGPFELVDGETYNGDGQTESAIKITFDPTSGSNFNSKSSFTVEYPLGISINDNYNESTSGSITITKNWYTDVSTTYYLKVADSGTTGDGTSLTFNIYSDAECTTSATLAAGSCDTHYTITFPESYFLLGTGDSQTVSDQASVEYIVSGTATSGTYSYTISYSSYGGSWSSNDKVTVAIYYTNASGETVYVLGSADAGEAFPYGSDSTYTLTFYTDEEIPAGAVCVFKAENECGGTLALDGKTLIFRKEETYMWNGFHYNATVPCYDTFYGDWNHVGLDISDKTITHRAAEWYKHTDSSHDTFNSAEPMTTTANGIDLQSANVYVDTIYMHKGGDITLTLPYQNGGGMSVTSYQRWYDYRTDGIYRISESEDLLMPVNNNGEIFRFKNGYVAGRSLEPEWHSQNHLQMNFHYPTDDEYREFDESAYYDTKGRDNTYYIVACDVSIYNDYETHSFAHYNSNPDDYNPSTDDAENSTYWDEPTLAGRTLFYIIGVGEGEGDKNPPTNLPEEMQSMWALLGEKYQGGKNDGDECYLEEYEITYPARRTSNKTLELVTLSKDARSYIIPGVNDTSTELKATFAETNSPFKMVDDEWSEENNWSSALSPVRGERRVIQFYKSGIANNSDPWSVNDGDTATILVTKTVNNITYNIARYKLTFKDNATPLTQTQLQSLDSDLSDKDYWWKDMTYRSHNYMDRNYKKVSELTFDYGDASDAKNIFTDEYGQVAGQAGFHAFPMDWTNTSYAFYDGRISTGTYTTDNDDNVTKNNDGTYWMDYNGSYTWYDTNGSTTKDIYTQWCMYSIVNDYYGYGDSETITGSIWHEDTQTSEETSYPGNSVRPYDTTGEKASGTEDYWLYIDASDRPGSVAEIRFNDQLCIGAQIYGTALIKSGTEKGSDDAAVMFTIMGVTENADGTTTHTPIYRQCSSQITATTYLNTTTTNDDGSTTSSYDVDESNLSYTETGKGSTTNEWFQLYFSFLNTQNKVDYDYYTLSIDNYCASTAGGDYYFDDVYLYIVEPTFIVEQNNPMCTTDEDAAASVRLMIDFAMIEARLGDDSDDQEHTTDAVSFMIINSNDYYDNLTITEEDDDDDDGDDDDDDDDDNDNNTALKKAIETAIQAAQVPFVYNGDTEEEKDGKAYYITLNYYQNFTDPNYEEYNGLDSTTGEYRTAGENTTTYNGNGYFYKYTEDGVQYLAVDCLADLSPYTPYKILLIHTSEYDELTNSNYISFFADCLSDDCQIASDFYVTSETILKVNGEATDPTVDYCAGQTIVVQPEVTYLADDTGNIATLTDEYYDWFFGTEQDYLADFYADNTEETREMSLYEALVAFRNEYPTATELTEDMKNDHFSGLCYDVIESYLNEPYISGSSSSNKSYHAQLVLYKQYLEVTIPDEKYLHLVVQPIGSTVYVLDENGDPKTETDEDGNTTYQELNVCFGYVPLTLTVGSDAPFINAGFADVNYPSDDFVPGIRLGMHHIEAATEDLPITVNLRGATYATPDTTDDSGEEIKVDHLGLLNSTEDLDGLYLIATDDPYYEDYFSDPYFSKYDLPIGKITKLYAEEGNDEGSYMTITFDSENYPLKEGYTYTVLVNCEEKDASGNAIGKACQGTLPIELKVVPEYLVWNGTEKDNWNNDMHWSRADVSDLNLSSSSDYTTNEANTTDNGFVPMLFTNVVIPQGGEVELYPAYFAASSSDGTFSWTGDEDAVYDDSSTDLNEHPTENIMYDMMVYAGELDIMGKQLSSRKKIGLYDQTSYEIKSMQTQRYRTNVCNEIHLSKDAQVLHSELLLCNRVWTDVAIPQNTWTLVSSPLKNIVAGDWYTTSATGTQADLPLFTDITFSDDYNDRYNPAVYQRSWETSGKIIYTDADDNRDVPAYTNTGWTAVYNDASVSYQPGEGYSIKGGYGDAATTDSLVFRFPKADEEGYTYGSVEYNSPDQGQLKIFSMVDRSSADDDYSSSAKGKITVDLSQEKTDNGYYIIGNPFTTYMSMSEFMNGNKQFSGYWLPNSNFTGGPIAGNGSNNGSWQVTSTGSNEAYVKPYSAFFVQVDENYTGTGSQYSVTFTPDMQVMSIGSEPTVLQFAIKASSAKGTSSASIAYSDAADNDYSLGEDVLLLTDNSWNNSQPMVYSVSGSNAVAVNMLADLYQIPIGVFATDDSEYTLTFVGIDKLDTPSLYDADLLTDTPLTEGYTLTLAGSTHGRYFLRSLGAAEGINDITSADDEVTIYSPTPHTLVVTATNEITSIEVYSLSGTALAEASPASLSCTLSGLPTGVTLVRTTTNNTTTTKKLYVR